jgi:DNA-directed RNA polymerase specialized sigma subunit
MDNIFATLTNQLPRASEEQQAAAAKPAAPDPASWQKWDTKTLVKEWQTEQKPEYTSELLKRMQPTINSAMTSYAPGMDRQLAVKAARLTLDALRTYKPDFNTEPSTHVFHTLKRLSRYGTRSGNIMPLPEGFVHEQKLLKAVMDKFEDEHNREPSMAELADLTGLSRRKLDKLLERNMVINESATLTDDSGKDTFTQSGLNDNDYFEYVYSSVGPTDQKIMEWSSGLHGAKQLSNNEIASKLHISAAAVSQRRNKIQKLLSDVRGLV